MKIGYGFPAQRNLGQYANAASASIDNSPKTRVSFLNGPEQPTINVPRGDRFEVVVPEGFTLNSADRAQLVSSRTVSVRPGIGRGGEEIPGGQVQVFTFQANKAVDRGTQGSLTFTQEKNIGRGGQPLAQAVMTFPLVLQ
jgi:hypothetical protein